MTQRIVLGLDLAKVDQATAVIAMLDAWEQAQEHALAVCQEPRTLREWTKARFGDHTKRQTALALVRILGIEERADNLTSSDIRSLDGLLARLRSGESIVKLKRETRRAANKNLF